MATALERGDNFDDVPDPEPIEDFNNEYRLCKLLEQGAYAEVVVARNKSTGQQYAAKIIKLKNRSAGAKDMLYNGTMMELRIIYALQGRDLKSGHDNIVKLKSWYADPNEEVILLYEKMSGDLRQRWVDYEDLLTEDEAKPIIRDIVSALAYMHEKQIMHRDIKMANILCVKDDSFSPVKLCDFNTSKYRGAYCLEPLSPIKGSIGTLDTYDPQRSSIHLQGIEEHYGRKGDIYSTGCVMFELLTSEYIFADITKCDDDKCPVKRGGFISECLKCMAVNLRLRTEKDFRADRSQMNNRSEKCKDFIEKLLARREKDRMTAEETLQHPWLKEPKGLVQKFTDVMVRPSWTSMQSLFGNQAS